MKRKEIDRLRELIGRKAKLHNSWFNCLKFFKNFPNKKLKILVQAHEIHTLLPKHLDHSNVETFEEKDLEHLIKAASNDLEEHDKIRRQEFKEHELAKEYERRVQLQVNLIK